MNMFKAIIIFQLKYKHAEENANTLEEESEARSPVSEVDVECFTVGVDVWRKIQKSGYYRVTEGNN